MTTAAGITLGLLAGSGLATAVAIAGAFGLGLAALAIKSRGGGRGYGGKNNGGHHGQHSGGYHSRTGGRRRRGASDLPAREEQAEQDWLQAKEKQHRIMQVVRAEDSSGCGLKLVCELAAMNEEALTKDHMAILDLVGPDSSSDESDF